MRRLLTGLAFQLRLATRSPDTLQALVTTPLLTLILMAITEHAHRTDIDAYTVVAPTLIAQWTLALFLAGEIISDERAAGTLEALIAAPGRLAPLILGRLCAVTTVGLASFAEAWLTAGLIFGHWLPVPHPWLFLAGLLITAPTMAATAAILSTAFVLHPAARIIQNTLSYPLYLLSGVLLPISTLPAILRPLSHLLFLSWSADLLRTCLQPATVPTALPHLIAIGTLGAISYTISTHLLDRVVNRVRRLGTLSQM